LALCWPKFPRTGHMMWITPINNLKRIPPTPLQKGGSELLAPLLKGGRGDSETVIYMMKSVLRIFVV
jgi:hypothetical protein